MRGACKRIMNPANTAIGVFDSGVGGLSVLQAIRVALPHENLIYVADSGYAPYGDQSQAHIIHRTQVIGQWLTTVGVKAITIACNTATVVAAKALREQTSLPVVAIEPAIKPAAALSRSGVVGVLATRQTVQSDAVAKLVMQHGANTRILLQSCPGWMELVERADLHSAHTQAVLRQFIEPLLSQGADILVLGCTHYFFLRDAIQRIVGDAVTLLDPAQAVARELVRRLTECGSLSTQPQQGQVQFFTSGNLAQAQTVMSHLWPEPLTVQALS